MGRIVQVGSGPDFRLKPGAGRLYYGLRPSDVLMELRRREGISGIDEKLARQDGIRIEAERKD